MSFKKESISISPEKEVERIVSNLRETVLNKLKKRGAVIGISGGVDSSVVLALCARAFGPNRTIGIMMPEYDSSSDSLVLAREVANKYNVPYIVENMTPALIGFECYKRRDEAIRRIFPEFDNTYKVKIILPNNLLEKKTLNVFKITIISPEGEEKTARLPLKEYLQIVAASNFKQRSRMCMLYYHAESRNYAVIGTANKNEHDLGFFVKFGDGGADVMPIVHLFKTQIYQLAKYLDIPKKIQERVPTSDTYSAEQT